MNNMKFFLKWNDFQQNASSAFKKLRKDKDLLDVTLVREDGEHISAHKIVLAASSDFFKDALKKANHSNPMIFLSTILDYIYNGEVNLFQEEIDGFLEGAQKLKGYSFEEKGKAKSGAVISNDATLFENQTSISEIGNSNVSQAYNYDELITQFEYGWKCNECDITATSKSNIKVYVEIHLHLSLNFHLGSNQL